MSSEEPFPTDQSYMYAMWKAEKEAMAAFRGAESEHAGHDIGQWRTEWLWWAHHQRSWRAAFRAEYIKAKPSA